MSGAPLGPTRNPGSRPIATDLELTVPAPGG